MNEKKIILITGATAGIGLHTALQLATKKFKVIITARSHDKAKGAINFIKKDVPEADLDYFVADLSSQSEVHRLANEFKQKYQHLDVLINNAGAVFSSQIFSADKIEMQWATNHLASFLLTHLFIDVLEKSNSARVINVSSDSHYKGKINFEDLYYNKNYFAMTAYRQTKLANVLFTYEAAQRWKNKGITFNALHPGMVDTSIGETNSRGIVKLAWSLARLFAISVEKGAETSTYLASAPEVENITAQYFYKNKAKKSSSLSYDKKLAQKLWLLSEKQCGIAAT